MAGTSLVQPITTESQVTGIGVFVADAAPTPRINAKLSSGVGIAIAAEWGPTTLWQLTNATAAQDRYWPHGTDAAWNAWAGLPWRKPLYLIRVVGSGATAASKTFNDDDPKASLIATAAYSGAAGNRIYVTVTANADDADERDVRVRVLPSASGTAIHDETYLAVQAADGSVTDPGDPYVTFSADGSADDSCVVAAETALTGGTSGTITATNVRTALDLLGSSSVDCSVVAVAGFADGIADGINEQMDQWAAASTGNDRIAFLMTPSDDDAAAAITAVANYRNTRCRQAYPRLVRSVGYARGALGYSTIGNQTVCPSLVHACAYQYGSAWTDFFLASWPRQVSASVVDLADTSLDLDDLASLRAAGIDPWFKSRQHGYVPYCDVATYLSSGEPQDGSLQRYKDYLYGALADLAEQYLGLPLDLDVGTQTLGTYTGRYFSQAVAFLRGEVLAGRLQSSQNDDGTTSPAFSLDPWALMTGDKAGTGRWDLQFQARKTPAFKRGVIFGEIGFVLTIRAPA